MPCEVLVNLTVQKTIFAIQKNAFFCIEIILQLIKKQTHVVIFMFFFNWWVKFEKNGSCKFESVKPKKRATLCDALCLTCDIGGAIRVARDDVKFSVPK